MLKKTIRFFDKLEDKIRARLSRHPIVYSLIGGVAVVLFWRGVWMTADEFSFLTGPVSIIISVSVLLLIGLFASFFVGDQIVISGLRKEKKLIEKTEEEVRSELSELPGIKSDLERIEREVRHIEELSEEQSAGNEQS
ncbi:MAG: hypothetical protein UX94_C0004G0043 [Parcubacteria group bacterium GW2011_GWA2_47_21]|nr:MAG: hypothetical protein UX94_C0004G0043 [Parcubacteria group bacterium GW2011_GWA2_47_21]